MLSTARSPGLPLVRAGHAAAADRSRLHDGEPRGPAAGEHVPQDGVPQGGPDARSPARRRRRRRGGGRSR